MDTNTISEMMKNPAMMKMAMNMIQNNPVMVNNIMTSTIGRVSMDMLYVDITNLKNASIGSEVELWGKNVPVDSVAEKSGTVGYELLCSISSSKRVPLRYLDA